MIALTGAPVKAHDSLFEVWINLNYQRSLSWYEIRAAYQGGNALSVAEGTVSAVSTFSASTAASAAVLHGVVENGPFH